jgi:ketosteroid isomerase-like protein
MTNKKLSQSALITLVLASFEAERLHNIEVNQALLHPDFAVTDMVISHDDKIFPRLAGSELKNMIHKAFLIEGRQFTFPTVVADEATQTVIIEFIEEYPDSKTGQVYRTPQVAICQIKDGKIFRTRHYMDPRLSYKELSMEIIQKAIET